MYVNLSQAKIYAVIFIVIISIYIGYLIHTHFNNKKYKIEHFIEDSEYQARMHVINVFDGYLARNPTPTEIDKYSKFENEHDILAAVMRDFPVVEEETPMKVEDFVTEKVEPTKPIETKIEITDTMPDIEFNGDKVCMRLEKFQSLKTKLQALIDEMKSLKLI